MADELVRKKSAPKGSSADQRRREQHQAAMQEAHLVRERHCGKPAHQQHAIGEVGPDRGRHAPLT